MFWVALPWLLSLFTIIILFLTTQKSMYLWPLGFVAQAFWLAYSLHNHSYGLMPASCILAVLYIRGYFKWRVAE